MKRIVVVAVVALLALSAACQSEHITEEKREIKDAGGKKLEDIVEDVRVNALGGKLVEERHILAGKPDAVLSLATLDPEGFCTGASYRREGPRGKRYVEFRRRDDGKLVVFSRGDDETLLLPDLPVVDLEMKHHLHPKPGSGTRKVVALDIENAVAVPATVDEHGRLDVPKPAPLTAGDPVLPMHTSRAPFIESQTKRVVTWCKMQAAEADTPVDAAHKVALAVKPKLDKDRGGGPPSAFWTEQIGGYDQGGAALTVACLRALGKPARVVTGTAAGAERTWAQVNDGKAWIDVDPLDIDVHGASHEPHAAVVEGFPGPLTTELLAGHLP